MEHHNFLKSNKGTTLLELVVAMTIYIFVMTMVVGFFIIIYRLQISFRFTTNMNQEARIVSEVFARNAREAYSLKVDGADLTTGSSDICSSAGGAPKNLTLTLSEPSILPSSVLQFTCDSGTIRHFQMVSPGASIFSNLTSEHVTVTNFQVFRPDGSNVFPRTLGYQFTLQKTDDPIIQNPLQSVTIRGYINMRNER